MIATIPVHGILTKRPSCEFPETTSYEELYESISKAIENPGISEIVLDIDSPGGEVSGLFDLCDFVVEACKAKLITAYANDNCLSAAYAIAASCSKVLVTRTSAVGSIGVIATHLDVSEADKKYGLKYTTIFKGARKNDLNPHEPLADEAFADLNDELDRLYEMFVELVARGRNMFASAVRATEAGIFYGENAVKAGLADAITTTFRKEKIMETETFRTDMAEISRLCRLAKMPEKLAEFVESGVSIDEARDSLMKALASKTEEIRSTISANIMPVEGPVVAAAKARANTINLGEQKW
jgi:signal peptide peptidase SppA